MSFKKLVEWSAKFHDLPWRKNRSLYNTLVSEIMLQQTTVPTVLNHFERFIKIYPDIESLSKTTEEIIQVNWKGLGYYRRAKNLLKAAQYICHNLDGEIPLNIDHLKEIPGIGDYTANAIMAIGANYPQICIDANLERVLSRYYLIDSEKGLPLKKELKQGFASKKYLKEIKSLGGRAVNEALMDLGREICLPQNAKCNLCPLNKNCIAKIESKIYQYPVVNQKKIDKKNESYSLELLRIIVKKENKILVYKKDTNMWLSGQLEVPTFIIKTDDPKLKQYPFLKNLFKNLPAKKFKTLITKYKITNYVLELTDLEWKEFSKQENLTIKNYFYNLNSKDQNLSTASFKAIAQ